MKHIHSIALAGLIAASAAAGPAWASPFIPVDLQAVIAVPADASNSQGGVFNAFDISFFDATTRTDYVADRSNAAVDIFQNRNYIGRTAAVFTGQGATTSVSGADGVVTVSNGTVHTLYAGDGDSTLKTFDLSGGPVPPTAQQRPPFSTGGTFRVDEMAYSPSANLVLVANNADGPAFGTLVNATTGALVKGHIVLPGAALGDGLEQPVWNPGTNSFFVSVPNIGGSEPGGIAEIHTDGTVGKIINFAAFGIGACAPTGLAVGASGHLMVGCGDKGTQTVVVDPTGAGSLVKTISSISASDELWYDPTTGNYYVTGAVGGKRVFDIISDASLNVLQSVILPVSASANPHSISVDPGNGDIYVPLAGNTKTVPNAFCPLGCVVVYGVPEPSSLPLLIAGLAGLAGFALRRRAHSA